MSFVLDASLYEAFPTTRFLGSKRKLLGVLRDVFARLEFDTALDPFCGTAAVAYLLKTMGKAVTASDALECNAVNARALVENDDAMLGDVAVRLTDALPDESVPPGFIEREFDELFFERDENRFLDGILNRIHALGGMRRELALHALCQAALAKRPYNLFHRANLSMRRREVTRTFGNKATWDKPFAEHFCHFARLADAAVHRGRKPCTARCVDVADVEPSGYELVYLDPPYVSGKGSGVDYLDYYHFLEGLCAPTEWPSRIMPRYRHKPLEGRGRSPWCDPARIGACFAQTLRRFASSTLVISYRSDGIPSIDELTTTLARLGKTVEVVDLGQYTYALSRNRASREVVLIGR